MRPFSARLSETRRLGRPLAIPPLFLGVWLLWITLAQPVPVQAGLTAESCLLVVNGDSPTSVRVANHYIQLRKIPARNVVYLPDIPFKKKQLPFVDFEAKILKPIIQAIQDRQLDTQIECIVFSTGFPTAVRFAEWFEKIDRTPHKIETPTASLTSMVYFYRHSMLQSPGIVSLESNAYARRPVDVVLKVPFLEKATADRFTNAVELYDKEEWATADREFGELLVEQPFQYGLAYWQARCRSRLGDREGATKALMDAIKRGWEFRKYTEEDPALADLKDYPPFKAAMKGIAEPFWGRASPQSFSARASWGPNGLPERLEGSPNAYLLCCMLGVTDGPEGKVNTEQEVLDYLSRSAKADGTRPDGVVYLADHKNVRSTTRVPNFSEAVAALDGMGIKSEVGRKSLPPMGTQVLGATLGSARFDWGESGAEFVPGAIGDNLTSYGGKLDKHNQTTVAEFLRFGAAGAMGTVVEPYAIQNKFPLPLIHAYYARGFSLVESYYLSVAGPCQTLLVGDPLCQPFAQPPGIEVEGVDPMARVDGTIRLQIKLSEQKTPTKAVDFYFDGRKIGALKSGNMALDTTRHPDGYHELRFVAIADDRTQATECFHLPLVFNNQGQSVRVRIEQDGNKIRARAEADGADKLTLTMPGQELDSTTDPRKPLVVLTQKTGTGPIAFQVQAQFGDQIVTSQPVVVDVQAANTASPPK